ncbi:Protein FAR1-RELATED SEQUENCE 6 [Acorus gramineus]|uniref:Protein FAR1-RELATED SEQUENCE n=1 Tax=Acorus gramineus TaxID=55184 RepID=A0AAV9AKB2_ACOGR|nr:Protein FAR1-RELATED SEQUENCE 6 [Acorus gramineus]
MSGHKPNAIVSDQCKVIQGAVSQVFPHSRHKLCLWHIMKSIPKKLGRHSIKVMIYTNTMEVSSHYILDRWRKGIKRKHNYVKNCYVNQMSNHYMRRHHELYSKFVNVAEAAAVSVEKLEFCKKNLDSLHAHLMNLSNETPNCSTIGEEPLPNSIVHSPTKVRRKGRPLSKRKAANVFKPRRQQVKKLEICNIQNVDEAIGSSPS